MAKWKGSEVMAEYINKAKLMRRLKKLSTEAYQFKFESKMETTINACIDAVDLMPTIDIVHCSECKWWDRMTVSKYGICHACKHGYLSDRWDISIHRKTEEEHYCADGERRTE